MIPNGRIKLLAFVMALVLAMLAGCGGSQSGGATTLTFAMGAEAKTLDPHNATDSPSGYAFGAIYEGLVTFNEKLETVPQLAETHSVSPDGLTYTFNLRKNVKFHDGEPLNATAVKKSFERVLNPDLKLARARLFEPFIKEIQIPDDHTVKIILHEPFGAFLSHMSSGAAAVISPKAIDTYGADLSKNAAGTGPFKLKDWTPGDKMTLERNPDYWGPKPQVERLVLKPVPEAGSRVVMLEKGEADAIFPLPATDVERLQANSDVVVKVEATNRVVYITLGKNPIFNDKRVRQAFNYAVDKEAITSKLLKGLGSPAKSALGPNNFGYVEAGYYEYNVERAKALLQEAGVNPQGTKIKLWTPDGRYLGDRQAAELVMANLKDLGFEIEFQTWEWGAYLDELDKLEEGSYEMILIGWAPSTGDADHGLRPLFTKDSIDNNSFFTDPRLDDLFAQGQRESNAQKRQQIYTDAQTILFDEAPWIYLYSINTTVGLRKGVSGVRVYANEHIDFSQAAKQ